MFEVVMDSSLGEKGRSIDLVTRWDLQNYITDLHAHELIPINGTWPQRAPVR
jgi:hypothetical protein